MIIFTCLHELSKNYPIINLITSCFQFVFILYYHKIVYQNKSIECITCIEYHNWCRIKVNNPNSILRNKNYSKFILQQKFYIAVRYFIHAEKISTNKTFSKDFLT